MAARNITTNEDARSKRDTIYSARVQDWLDEYSTPDDDNFDTTELSVEKDFKNSWMQLFKYLFLEILTFVGFVACFSLAFAESCYGEYECYRNMMLGCFFSATCLIILLLNHTDRFDLIIGALSSSKLWKFHVRGVIIGAFLFIGMVDFFLLSMSVACVEGDTDCEQPLLDPFANGGLVRHVTRTLTAFCAVLSALTVLAYWDHFSYISAHNVWVHAILYCTIIGGLFLEISRWIRSPEALSVRDRKNNPNWSWHVKHPKDKLLDWIMLIVLATVVMFVWLSTIVVPIFTEIAEASLDWGKSSATLIYCILALILGICPLAPGTVGDAMGGFLLVQIYMNGSEGYSFLMAVVVALLIVVVLHFIGSCLQYWIGKIKSVQRWANFALPSDMLAASDSVLEDANFVMVGLIGQVFMDTFSGLNQGRMNMGFCRQFWSEYASIPSAFCWVATGAVISVQGASGYAWAENVIPICFFMAAAWQFIGSTYGGYQLLKANKEEKFWMNKEKWETVQHFAQKGIRATSEGWKSDCFGLRNIPEEGSEDGCSSSAGPLFEEIRPIHDFYMEGLLEQNCIKAAKILQKKYNSHRSKVRNEHWSMLINKYFASENECLRVRERSDWFITAKPLVDATKLNEWRQKEFCGCSLQMVFVLSAVFSGIYSYVYIAMEIETEDAVQRGMDVWSDISTEAWGIFVFYNLVVFIYYWRSCWDGLLSGLSYTLLVLRFQWIGESKSNEESVFRCQQVSILRNVDDEEVLPMGGELCCSDTSEISMLRGKSRNY